MTRLLLVLVVSLALASPSAAQTSHVASGSLLSQALARTSASVGPQRPLADEAAWSRVQSIVTGTEVLVATDTHPEARRVFVSASQKELLAIRIDAFPADATHALVEALRRDPTAALSLEGPGFKTDRLSITPDGVVWRGAKLADLGSILDRAPREQIQIVKGLVHRTNRTLPTVVGAVIGGAIGFVSAAVTANTDNIGRTRGQSLMVVSLVGMPTAGALLGRWSSMHDEQTVYYIRHD